jgi:hypothetical protein
MEFKPAIPKSKHNRLHGQWEWHIFTVKVAKALFYALMVFIKK